MSFVLYANAKRGFDQYPRSYVPVFEDASTARAWLDKMLHGREYERDGDKISFETDPGYTTSMPITIRSEQLDKVLAASPGTLSYEHDRWVMRFKYGTWDEVHEQRLAEAAEDDTPKAQRAPKPERQAKASVPDGYTSITELCANWNVPARVARAALRASGRVKPVFGWSFAPNEVAAVKKLVVSAS